MEIEAPVLAGTTIPPCRTARSLVNFAILMRRGFGPAVSFVAVLVGNAGAEYLTCVAAA